MLKRHALNDYDVECGVMAKYTGVVGQGPVEFTLECEVGLLDPFDALDNICSMMFATFTRELVLTSMRESPNCSIPIDEDAQNLKFAKLNGCNEEALRHTTPVILKSLDCEDDWYEVTPIIEVNKNPYLLIIQPDRYWPDYIFSICNGDTAQLIKVPVFLVPIFPDGSSYRNCRIVDTVDQSGNIMDATIILTTKPSVTIAR